jgi:hypothetical protein
MRLNQNHNPNYKMFKKVALYVIHRVIYFTKIYLVKITNRMITV